MRDLLPKEREAITNTLASIPEEHIGTYEFKAIWLAGREFERAENAMRVHNRLLMLNDLAESMRSEIGAIKGGTHGAL